MAQAAFLEGSNRAGFEIFLTAYDPSDLPGGSSDPLGFEQGYLFLADKILPGLTNVANQPRYFSVLCARVHLAKIDEARSPRQQYGTRLEVLLRFERFWALANVLAALQEAEDLPSAGGVRGVTYAKDEADRLNRRGASVARAHFKLLSRQPPYGVLGIYGAVAEGMRFIDRKSLALARLMQILGRPPGR